MHIADGFGKSEISEGTGDTLREIGPHYAERGVHFWSWKPVLEDPRNQGLIEDNAKMETLVRGRWINYLFNRVTEQPEKYMPNTGNTVRFRPGLDHYNVEQICMYPLREEINDTPELTQLVQQIGFNYGETLRQTLHHRDILMLHLHGGYHFYQPILNKTGNLVMDIQKWSDPVRKKIEDSEDSAQYLASLRATMLPGLELPVTAFSFVGTTIQTIQDELNEHLVYGFHSGAEIPMLDEEGLRDLMELYSGREDKPIYPRSNSWDIYNLFRYLNSLDRHSMARYLGIKNPDLLHYDLGRLTGQDAIFYDGLQYRLTNPLSVQKVYNEPKQESAETT